MNIKIQRVIFAILTIITFVAIFIFSNQNGEKSGSTSRTFTRKIVEIFRIDKNLNEIEKEELIANSQYIIRKLAHFTIYTIAGINIYGFINTYNIKKSNKIISTFLIGVIYAISDEAHQMFSGGRTPAVKDVCIDTLGVMIGICIFIVVNKIIKCCKEISRKN